MIEPPRLSLWTDGSGTPQGPGGWAYVLTPYAVEKVLLNDCGAIAESTSSRSEMYAAIHGLDAVSRRNVLNIPLEVVSDSAYLVNGFTQGWVSRWTQNGWINRSGQPVANQDLWLRLANLASYFRSLTWRHVRGHKGLLYNEMCDKQAGQMRKLALSCQEISWTS